MSKGKKILKKGILCIIGSILVILIIWLIISHFVLNKGEESPYYQPETRHQQASVTSVEDSVTLGWLMVQGTNIDYPVVYETNSVYQGLYDYAWVSNHYIEGENRMVIFGHNVLNISNKPIIGDKDHTRFEQLMGFVYEDFAKENLYIQYSHDGGDELYKIYAVNFEEHDTDIGKSSNNANELKEYIKLVRQNSIYDYDIDVNENDQLITLSTCTRFFGANGKTTFKVDARKVRSSEKINKYEVQKSKNYDMFNLE